MLLYIEDICIVDIHSANQIIIEKLEVSLFLQGGFDPTVVTTTLASSRSTTIGTPGAQVGFIPTGTAVPCLVYTPRPYLFD